MRAVLFDLDNTLLLEDRATELALRRACALGEERTGVSANALLDAVRASAIERWEASAVYPYTERFGIWWGELLWGEFGGDDPDLRAIAALVPSYRLSVWRDALATLGIADDALAAELADAYRVARRAEQVVDPAADDVLADLARDHLLALVTNGAPDVQRAKLAATSLARHFRKIVISCEAGVAKPDPRVFEIALEALDVPASEAAMVGDSLVRDVAGARASGLRSIWLDRGLWPDERGPEPDVRISALSEIRAALAAPAPERASPRGSP